MLKEMETRTMAPQVDAKNASWSESPLKPAVHLWTSQLEYGLFQEGLGFKVNGTFVFSCDDNSTTLAWIAREGWHAVEGIVFGRYHDKILFERRVPLGETK